MPHLDVILLWATEKPGVTNTPTFCSALRVQALFNNSVAFCTDDIILMSSTENIHNTEQNLKRLVGHNGAIKINSNHSKCFACSYTYAYFLNYSDSFSFFCWNTWQPVIFWSRCKTETLSYSNQECQYSTCRDGQTSIICISYLPGQLSPYPCYYTINLFSPQTAILQRLSVSWKARYSFRFSNRNTRKWNISKITSNFNWKNKI